MTNVNNNVHNNGVERVNTIMDNQQKEIFSFDELLSKLTRSKNDAIIRAVNAGMIQNKTKKTIDMQYASTKLHEMAQMQNDLDTFIIKSCNTQINKNELVGKLVIALDVELFELLNECRSIFKYWSSKPENPALILEEYADGIHFILSLGNHTGKRNDVINHFLGGLFLDLPPFTGIQTIVKNIVLIESIPAKAFYYGVIAQLLHFDMPMIYDAYKRKHEKNIDRQNNGY